MSIQGLLEPWPDFQLRHIRRVAILCTVGIIGVVGWALITLDAQSHRRAVDFKALNRRHIQFVDAYNVWQDRATKISPYSPDASTRVRQDWLKRDMGEKFRRLERVLEATE